MDPLNQNKESLTGLTASLQSIPEKVLGSQSQYFLTLDSEQRLEYIEQTSGLPGQNNVEIVCITTLKMHSVDKHAVSCLVVGTEEGDIIILEPTTFTTAHMVSLTYMTLLLFKK